MAEFIGSLGLIGTIFFIGLAILWILLPFAVFGIKSKLDIIVELLENLVEYNKSDHSELKKQVPEKAKLSACLNCDYYIEVSENYKRCKKTEYNLVAWRKKQYLKTNMNPCEGRYFKQKLD